MRRSKNSYWMNSYCMTALMVMLATTAGAPIAYSQYAPGGPKFRGTVKSSDGKPLEGVTVSVRGEGKTFVTTVFTNEQGVYVFPPLENGVKFSLWAQAQGFETARLDVESGSGEIHPVAELQLNPLKNFEKQLTGVEWMNSFPENTPAEKREKRIYATNCSGCHANQFTLQNRFDAESWGKIVRVMSMSSNGTPVRSNAAGTPTIEAYKDDIVRFLTKVRGPVPANYELKPLPRPTGEAAQVVITEFDLPRPEAPPEYYIHNGSDWMEGTPSRWQGRAAHDATVGPDGSIFLSDETTLDASIFKLDTQTGKVTSYKFPAKNGGTASTHGIAADPEGNIWTNNQSNDNLLMFDPKTERFVEFLRPETMPGARNTVAIDQKVHKGIIWSATFQDGAIKLDPQTGKSIFQNGALSLDPTTGKYSFYPLITGKDTYGVTVDREGHAWYSSPGSDRVDVADAETGKTAEIVFPPAGPETGMEITDVDKENYSKLYSLQNSATPLHNCPRRIGADANADVVWVALYCADKIAKIDIHTHQVTQYALPHKYSYPYGVVVDNEHNVWINLNNADMLAKFNPATETFTEYQMPSRGTVMRHLAINYTVNPPEIIAAETGLNKVARIQFRKGSDME
jgi:virginiamycin B lyase